MEFEVNGHRDFRKIIGGKTKEEWIEWRKQFTEGDPVPQDNGMYTVEQLKEMGYVGLYK